MSPTASKALRVAVSLALAALLLWVFLKNLDLRAVGDAIGKARPGWVVVAVVTSIVMIPIRSWRWTWLLRTVGKVRQRDANVATCIGFAATTLLPARAGEVVRPVALSRLARVPLAPSVLSILIERLLDLLSVLVLFIVYALGGFAPTEVGGDASARLDLLRRSALVLGVVTAVALVVMSALGRRPEAAMRFLEPFLAKLPRRFADRLRSLASHLLAALQPLETARDAAVLAASSAALWLVICFQIHATLLAFDLRFPYPVTFFVLAWAVLGLAIPTPGGVGGYHAAVAYCLTGFYAVPAATAAAFAVVAHAISFVPITILGLLFLGASGLSLGKLREDGAAPT